MTYKPPTAYQAPRLAALKEAEDHLRRRVNHYITRECLAVMDRNAPADSRSTPADFIASFDPQRNY